MYILSVTVVYVNSKYKSERKKKKSHSVLSLFFKFCSQLSKFTVFQQTLLELYQFAIQLPGETCPSPPTTHPPTVFPTTTPITPTSGSSASSSRSSSSYSSSSSSSSSSSVTTATLSSAVNTMTSSSSLSTLNSTTNDNATALFANSTGNYSTGNYSNRDGFDSTTSPPPSTALPVTTTKPPKKPVKKKTLHQQKKDLEDRKLGQIYRLWAKMQGSVCGVEANYNEEAVWVFVTHHIKTNQLLSATCFSFQNLAFTIKDGIHIVLKWKDTFQATSQLQQYLCLLWLAYFYLCLCLISSL